jgi:hypothetical protein
LDTSVLVLASFLLVLSAIELIHIVPKKFGDIDVEIVAWKKEQEEDEIKKPSTKKNKIWVFYLWKIYLKIYPPSFTSLVSKDL